MRPEVKKNKVLGFSPSRPADLSNLLLEMKEVRFKIARMKAEVAFARYADCILENKKTENRSKMMKLELQIRQDSWHDAVLTMMLCFPEIHVQS